MPALSFQTCVVACNITKAKDHGKRLSDIDVQCLSETDVPELETNASAPLVTVPKRNETAPPLTLEVSSALRLPNRGRRLESETNNNVLAIADAALGATTAEIEEAKRIKNLLRNKN